MFLLRALILSDQGLTLMTSFNLIYFLGCPTSKSSHTGGQSFNVQIWREHRHSSCALIIHRFHVCEFTSSRYNLFMTPRSILIAFLWSFANMQRKVKILSCPACTLPAEVAQGDALTCFSSHTINNCPFYGLFSATCLTYLCFYW